MVMDSKMDSVALKSVYEGSIVGSDAGKTLGGLAASGAKGDGINQDSAAVSTGNSDNSQHLMNNIQSSLRSQGTSR